MEIKMKWLYCSDCKWTDAGPNVYMNPICPKCGSLLLFLEGNIREMLTIYDYIKLNSISLLEYLEKNIIRKSKETSETII